MTDDDNFSRMMAKILDRHLFEPFKLAGHLLPSRFVMPAMQRLMCVDGAPGVALARYYRRRGEGGVGMIVGESCAVDHRSAWGSDVFARMDASTVDAWRGCINEVTATGAAMLVQLWHEGAVRDDADGHTLSPSGLVAGGVARGRAATVAEIGEIGDAFVRSAVMAQDAGANGVEIHAAHGYLLDQFLWPATNLRDDVFGGATIRDRARLLVRIIEGIRRRCGDGFIISVRFSQWKERDFAARIVKDDAELSVFAGLLRDAGATVLHCSTRRFWEAEWPGARYGLAGWTKRLGGLPTIAVGSFALDRDVMESFMSEGEAEPRFDTSISLLNEHFIAGDFDLIAIGRGLLADADLVRKLRDNALDDVIPFRRDMVSALNVELH